MKDLIGFGIFVIIVTALVWLMFDAPPEVFYKDTSTTTSLPNGFWDHG